MCHYFGEDNQQCGIYGGCRAVCACRHCLMGAFWLFQKIGFKDGEQQAAACTITVWRGAILLVSGIHAMLFLVALPFC